MPNFELLNNVDHQNLRVIRDRGAQFGDNVKYALTFPFEFRNIQHSYPILFQSDAQDNRFPVALFGFEEGENLFLRADEWDASYIPAMMRKDPFLIGYQEQQTDHGLEKVRVLSLDMDHPRISRSEGEVLFQPLGGNSEFLESTADLLEQLYHGLEHCKHFSRALQAHDLLESVTLEITLQDGTTNQLLGFDTIAEEKVHELSADVLKEFAQQHYLMPLFMILASMSNIQTLIDKKNQRVS